MQASPGDPDHDSAATPEAMFRRGPKRQRVQKGGPDALRSVMISSDPRSDVPVAQND